MPMLEGRVDAVIGVDTHRDCHAAALLDPNGGVRATLAVPSDRAGHARLLQLAVAQAPGRRVWARAAWTARQYGHDTLGVDQDQDDVETVVVLREWAYRGAGYQTPGEAALAAAIACYTREQRRIARAARAIA